MLQYPHTKKELRMADKNSKMKKFWTIVAMLVILLIPTAFIFGIVDERQNYKEDVLKDITNSWGKKQVIYAPQMFVDRRNTFEIENYDVEIKIDTQMKKRGIFKIPVYTADVNLKGEFSNKPQRPVYDYYKEDLKTNEIKPMNLAGKNASFSINIDDKKGLLGEPKFKIDTDEMVSAPQLSYNSTLTKNNKTTPFEIKYKLKGSSELYVVPVGRNNKIKIEGNWAHPSFQGDFLPIKSKVDKNNFSAEWEISRIATNNSGQQAGVCLINPVDNYTMTVRTLKYAVLFLALTFISYFIFEITSPESKRIHPIQYCLLGGAMLVFYLLLVSMSEIMPFGVSYLICSIMIISLLTSYTYFVVTKKSNKTFSAIICGLLTILYAFLYVLLSLADFALLIGSLGLFIIIGVIMYVTRNVDWYNENKGEQ